MSRQQHFTLDVQDSALEYSTDRAAQVLSDVHNKQVIEAIGAVSVLTIHLPPSQNFPKMFLHLGYMLLTVFEVII